MEVLKFLVFNLLLYSNLNLGYAGSLIQVFKETSFKGDHFDGFSSTICSEVPKEYQIEEGSLKTNGCITVYASAECKTDAYGFVIEYDQPTLKNLAKEYRNAADVFGHRFKIESFRDCTSMESDSKVQLDFWELRPPTKSTSQFPDVCGCIQLPNYESPEYEYGVNTYGTCFDFYSTTKCQGEPIFRISKLKSKLASLDGKSAKPCRIPIKCGKFKTSIFNLIPAFNESMLVGTLKDATVDSTQVFINNGTSTVVELYSVKRILSETVKYEFSEGFRDLVSSANTVKTVTEKKVEKVLEKSFSFSVTIPIQAISLTIGFSRSETKTATSTFSKAVKSVMEDKSEEKVKNEKTTTVTNTRMFEVRKKITLPACTKYEVSSFVEIVDGVEMNYKVQFEIKALTTTGFRMTSKDILFGLTQSGSKLHFLTEDPRWNNFTAVAESTMKLKVNVGLNSVVHGKGEIMQDCIDGHNMCLCNCS